MHDDIFEKTTKISPVWLRKFFYPLPRQWATRFWRFPLRHSAQVRQWIFVIKFPVDRKRSNSCHERRHSCCLCCPSSSFTIFHSKYRVSPTAESLVLVRLRTPRRSLPTWPKSVALARRRPRLKRPRYEPPLRSPSIASPTTDTPFVWFMQLLGIPGRPDRPD